MGTASMRAALCCVVFAAALAAAEHPDDAANELRLSEVITLAGEASHGLDQAPKGARHQEVLQHLQAARSEGGILSKMSNSLSKMTSKSGARFLSETQALEKRVEHGGAALNAWYAAN